mmetsp:Transcript_31894/g.68871  ORF Transcript_31894/g.68871 Transcript_31894/m.68871 type:complete len:130 (+) Transcript_31894:552-941(+)
MSHSERKSPTRVAAGKQMAVATMAQALSQSITTAVLDMTTGANEKRLYLKMTWMDLNQPCWDDIEEKSRENVHVVANTSTREDNLATVAWLLLSFPPPALRNTVPVMNANPATSTMRSRLTHEGKDACH